MRTMRVSPLQFRLQLGRLFGFFVPHLFPASIPLKAVTLGLRKTPIRRVVLFRQAGKTHAALLDSN